MSESFIKSDGMLKVAIDWEVDVIDPPASFGGWNTGRVVQQTHESLVEDDLNAEGLPYTNLIPALAESYEVSEDGLTYKFHLRKGVKFHDGTQFDADAVKFNIERIWNPEAPHYNPVAADYNQLATQSINNVTVLDAHTVQIELDEPFPEFLRCMTQEDAPGSFVFISPQAIKKYGNEKIGDIAPGTGPFMFKERFETQYGTGVILVRNPEYWGEKPLLESIKFIPIPDADERANALERGEVDVAYGANSHKIPSFRDKGFGISESQVPYVWYFSFNMNESPFNNISVRRAIAHAIDRPKMAKKLFGEGAKAAMGILPPASPSFEADFPDFYPYDLDKARSLLSKAGYLNGIKLKLYVAGGGQQGPVDICNQIKHDLSKIDIAVETVVEEDWLLYCDKWKNGLTAGIGATEMSWGMSCDVWIEQVLHSRYTSPKGFNTGYYNSNEVDRLLDLARTEISDKRRTELYRVAHRLIMRDLPVLPLFNAGIGGVIYNKRVKGLKDPAQNWNDFKTVWLES